MERGVASGNRRADEVEDLLERVPRWAERRPDVRAVGLAGSRAREEARPDSDVDLIALTREPERYLASEEWTRELGGGGVVKTERWGPMTERRFLLSGGTEVEFGIAPLRWAATDPVDPNLLPIIRAGFRVLYDPDRLLGDLVEACRR